MKLILGLGNPGIEYLNSRHNAGMMLVDKIAENLKSEYGWRKHFDALIYKTPGIVLVKSKDIFMNESGKLLQGLPEGQLYLAHDDLDIRLGEYKIQLGTGPKVHYGVQSVESTLGNKDFWRIRIGVDNRPLNTEHRTPGEEYVLQKFNLEEKKILEGVLDEIAKATS